MIGVGGRVEGAGVSGTEVVEHVGEIGQVNCGGTVEVAVGPVRRSGTEVVENRGEVAEVNAAIDVGIAEQFLGDEDGVAVDGDFTKSRPAEVSVVDDGDGHAGAGGGTDDAGGMRASEECLVLEVGEEGGAAAGGLDDELVVGDIERARPCAGEAIERYGGEFDAGGEAGLEACGAAGVDRESAGAESGGVGNDDDAAGNAGAAGVAIGLGEGETSAAKLGKGRRTEDPGVDVA